MIPILPRFIYKNVLKPLLFLRDPEKVHDGITNIGRSLGNYGTLRKLTEIAFLYKNPALEQEIDGITFANPIGLSAGFNYDGHFAGILNNVGFGFHTVGTVTARPYEGNTKPRLARLPKSRSLLVNKGFKSLGADAVASLLDAKDLSETTMGISVGSSNIPKVSTISEAIEDYLYTFKVFEGKTYVKYFELNISCPNTAMPESFTKPENLRLLINAVAKLSVRQPIYIKMPNELDIPSTNKLTDVAVGFGCIKGFIFSNLVKKRSNKAFDPSEIEKMKAFKGNFSGKPTEKNANVLIKNARKKYGDDITIIGCGGVFSAADAQKKLDAGANLVQLITGMVYEGPQLIGEINKRLAANKTSVKLN